MTITNRLGRPMLAAMFVSGGAGLALNEVATMYWTTARVQNESEAGGGS